MHKKLKNRIVLYLFSAFIFSSGVFLILYNFSENSSFFLTPTEILVKSISSEVKLGGYVKEGSLFRKSIDEAEFYVTDQKTEIKVRYKGPIPIIFREGQGVVATGKYDSYSKIFIATELLAKHDEKYMPPQMTKKP